MLRFERRGFDADSAVAELGKTVPLGRIAEPDDIADVVHFLASNASRYLCGSLVESEWRETGGMNRFTGKVALVTGGRSGIGYAIAERLSRKVPRYRPTRTCNEYPSIEADFALEDTAQSVVKQVIEETGRLDVLINNAGMMVESRVEDMTFAEWQQTLMVNLSSPFC